MLTSRLALGTAATIVTGVLILVIILQSSSFDSSTATAVTVTKSATNANISAQTSAPASNAAKVAPPQVAPAPVNDSVMATAGTDSAASVSPTVAVDIFEPTSASAAAQASASPASANGSSMGNNTSHPMKWLTVTDGQLSMTTVNADGTVSTVPYKEMSATATITPGTRPNEYVVTFHRETDDKIVARMTRVPDSTAIGPNGYLETNK